MAPGSPLNGICISRVHFSPTFTGCRASIAGIPPNISCRSLVGSLSGLAQKQDNAVFRQVLTNVQQTVEQGHPLSRAMAAHPQVFNAAYVRTVREGEINGNLDVTLRRYAAN